MTLKDRIRDYITDHKGTIIKVLLVVAIAAAVSGIIAAGVKAGIDSDLAALSAEIDSIVATGPPVTQDQLDAIDNQSQSNRDKIGGLQTKLGNLQNLFNTMQNDLAGAICSPPEGYLTGPVGNYTLHAKASGGGEFTANVYLVYSPPVSSGNATTYNEAMRAFYESVDWTDSYVRGYVCTVAYNGTAWGIGRVSFSIGIFALEASTEATIDIMFGGLNSTYEPDFAYVEVYPVL